jgi:Fur family ferric uptake transcriptional regulator
MSRNNDKGATAAPRSRVNGALDRFRSYLRREGLRFTAQRRAVLEEAMRRADHFDADHLCEALRSAGEGVSRATVYRTLGHLRECGLVKEVLQCRGRASYETVYGIGHHDHMLCVECGKVIEFRDDKIEEQQRRVCRRHGFKSLEHRMGIRGICKECLAKRDEEAG